MKENGKKERVTSEEIRNGEYREGPGESANFGFLDQIIDTLHGLHSF